MASGVVRGTVARVPLWFRAVAVVLLLWGLSGVFAWAQQVRLGPEAMGPATDYDRALYARLPGWYNLVYGVAVFAGVIGALALLLRRGDARLWFVVAVAAEVAMFGWLFASTDIVAVKGAGTVLPFPLFIIAVSALSAWLAGWAARRGWIG